MKGSLTFVQREVLSALIVIEVHSRDVTQTLLDNEITNVNDFDWISQLRYDSVILTTYTRYDEKNMLNISINDNLLL